MYLIMYAEVFHAGRWEEVGKRFNSALPEMEGQLTDRPCDERNYVLYEVLTGEHFKQNDGIEGIIPICTCDNLMNGHQAYSLRLSQLLMYNWNLTINNFGLISEWQYKRLKDKEILPGRIRKYATEKFDIVSPSEMDVILQDSMLRNKTRYWVYYRYNQRLVKDECRFFCNETIPRLKELVPLNGSYDDVRIVYWFNET